MLLNIFSLEEVNTSSRNEAAPLQHMLMVWIDTLQGQDSYSEQGAKYASQPPGFTYLFKFFSPTRSVGNCNYDAAIYTLRSEDSGLPSNPIRRVQEIAGMCVVHAIGKVVLQFNISISIRQWKGFCPRRVCRVDICTLGNWSALNILYQKMRDLQTGVSFNLRPSQ